MVVLSGRASEFLRLFPLRSRILPGAPLNGRITRRITQPWIEPADEKERETVKKIKEQIERSIAKSKKG